MLAGRHREGGGVIIGVHHGGIAVVDIQSAIDHFTLLSDWMDVHELERGHPLVPATGARGSALLRGPNAFVEFVEVDGPVSPRRTVAEPGVTHLSIQLPEMDRKNRQLSAMGVERHAEPVELGTGFSYLYTRDTEHNVIEIEGAAHAPPDLETWFSHVGIATSDVDRLRICYEQLFGAPAIASVRVAETAALDQVTALDSVDVTMTWVPAANANVELLQFHHPATAETRARSFTTPGGGHLCLEVDGIAEEVERAVALGMTLVADVVDSGSLQVARVADVAGNVVEFVAFENPDDPLSLHSVESFTRYRDMDALLAERSVP